MSALKAIQLRNAVLLPREERGRVAEILEHLRASTALAYSCEIAIGAANDANWEERKYNEEGTLSTPSGPLRVLKSVPAAPTRRYG